MVVKFFNNTFKVTMIVHNIFFKKEQNWSKKIYICINNKYLYILQLHKNNSIKFDSLKLKF